MSLNLIEKIVEFLQTQKVANQLLKTNQNYKLSLKTNKKKKDVLNGKKIIVIIFAKIKESNIRRVLLNS